VKRIFPVVVAAGRLWQTSNLWDYLDHARDPDKCKSFEDGRVQPLRFDAGDYEQLLALAHHGSNLPDLLARKTSGPYRHRDLAVWLNQDPQAPGQQGPSSSNRSHVRRHDGCAQACVRRAPARGRTS
jgi:hypothetical protein